MSELYDKSLKKLELGSVLEMLADCAVSQQAKECCLAIAPVNDAEDVRTLQRQTSAACKLVSLKGSPSFSGIKDICASLDRADRGGSLSAAELLHIGSLLRCTRGVKSYYDGDTVETELDPMFFDLVPVNYLEERISTSILSEEEIADAASHELADIRRQMRIQSAKIKESLQKIIASPAYAKFLRDPIITIRSDRYVVPVRSEFKNEIPGLVHDVSSSGGTYFVEPMSAVNANNALRELSLQENKEIERILAELSFEVAKNRESIKRNFQTLVALDVIFAKARLSYQMKAMEPAICNTGVITLKQARHPLIDPKKVVPITVRLGSDFETLIITGPNTGGKTVTLKTIGLLTLMAECGLHIPVEDDSCISVFDRILADIGDEQSIEQSLSTFSAHMKNIVEIVEQCDPNSLILFDELGAGTDPAEGAALAIALIEFCRKMGAHVAATTHYAELKLYAMRTDGVMNASCEFNVETLQPTYRLLIGVPGKSNAFAISRRLGLAEHIIQDARELVDENNLHFEDVLSQLEQQRQEMEAAKQEAERLRLEIAQTKQKSDAYYEQIKKEHDKAMQEARKEAQQIIEDARRASNMVYDELKQLRKQWKENANAQGFNEKQSSLRRSLNEAEEKLSDYKVTVDRPKASRQIQVGDTVELVKIGSKATVLAVNKDGSYQLQAGIMKITAREDEVYLLENYQKTNAKKVLAKTNRQLRNTAASNEVDLRGMDSIEAICVLNQFLDNSMMSNLNTVRIIHGKGTGVLRAAVQAELRRHKHVKHFRLGTFGEGEDGVTIAELC